MFVLLSVFSALCFFCLFLGTAFLIGRNPVSEMVATRSPSSLAESFGRLLERVSFLRPALTGPSLARDLRRAGWRLSSQEFSGIWFGCGAAGALAAAALVSIRPQAFLLALPIPLVAFALPRFLLSRKASEMQKQLERDFLIFVEKTAVYVAASVLPLKVLEKQSEIPGPLGAELKILVEELGGTLKEEPLRRFADRVGTDAARDFAAAVINALRHGSENLPEALLAQAREIRRAREMKIEEISRKMEIKTIIPVVLTVLPAAAILLLGPLAVGLVRSMRGG
ncbi:tight adherence protein C [Thermodesulfitimonas autotrophica]|uniref:Tight adherence protein C n=1 Tax=Thermodesulfitimonas autotrophica TaxID=1894989 RepID=A0A3N5B1S8_9THEO|nr:type II secretion system F family protein [Thermodesulfitimonas autotrophica]RPF49580.1 tight adherence protein C [Thermodesulfitimonas autotrophica]